MTVTKTTIERDQTMPLIEQVREITEANTKEGEELNFVPAALALGASQSEAEDIGEQLFLRIMRVNGMV